jgi:phenylacetate-CoA ligase
VVSTSGTTGHPGIFLFNPTEWVGVIASFARAREWAGMKVDLTRRSRMAVVSTTNERNASARLGKAADTPFIPTLRLDATRPLPEIVAALNRWRPEVLVAYASMAYFLAAEQLSQDLAIHPRAVFTSSEVLTEQMRDRVTEAWGHVVFDEYASTETATIAAEDTHHHGMHVFEDLLILENVDGENRPVPPGAFGEKLLVTVLFSRTQPLIRYEISDSVRFAEAAPGCGLPFQVIDQVQGRREDILTLSGLDGSSTTVHPNVFHDVMDAIPNRGWQIVQQATGLQVLVVPLGPLEPDAVTRQVLAALLEHGAGPVEIEVRRADAIPKSASGKSPLIQAYRGSDPPSG